MAPRFPAMAAAAATLVLLTAPAPFRANGWAKDLAPGQVDVDGRVGPRRSPDVVIEAPRPPTGAIETEGRGEHRNCRSVIAGDSPDGTKITSTEQPCDH
jgi:hypothetical protein